MEICLVSLELRTICISVCGWQVHRRATKIIRGAGEPMLKSKYERVGLFQPGEEKVLRRPSGSLSVFEEGYRRAGERLQTKAWSDGTKDNGFKWEEG